MRAWRECVGALSGRGRFLAASRSQPLGRGCARRRQAAVLVAELAARRSHNQGSSILSCRNCMVRCRRLCVLCSASHSRVAATHRCGRSLFGHACFVGCASLAASVRFAGRRAAADVAAVALRWSSGGGLRLIVRLFALSVRCVRALAVAARAGAVRGGLVSCQAGAPRRCVIGCGTFCLRGCIVVFVQAWPAASLQVCLALWSRRRSHSVLLS